MSVKVPDRLYLLLEVRVWDSTLSLDTGLVATVLVGEVSGGGLWTMCCAGTLCTGLGTCWALFGKLRVLSSGKLFWVIFIESLEAGSTVMWLTVATESAGFSNGADIVGRELGGNFRLNEDTAEMVGGWELGVKLVGNSLRSCWFVVSKCSCMSFMVCLSRFESALLYRPWYRGNLGRVFVWKNLGDRLVLMWRWDQTIMILCDCDLSLMSWI